MSRLRDCLLSHYHLPSAIGVILGTSAKQGYSIFSAEKIFKNPGILECNGGGRIPWLLPGEFRLPGGCPAGGGFVLNDGRIVI